MRYQRIERHYLHTPELAERTGVNEFLLHRWVNDHVIEPSETGFGSGHRHGWTPEDVYVVKVVGAVSRTIPDYETLRAVRIAVKGRRPTDDVVVIEGKTAYCVSVTALAELELTGAATLAWMDLP